MNTQADILKSKIDYICGYIFNSKNDRMKSGFSDEALANRKKLFAAVEPKDVLGKKKIRFGRNSAGHDGGYVMLDFTGKTPGGGGEPYRIQFRRVHLCSVGY
jgi:hypothetical protein